MLKIKFTATLHPEPDSTIHGVSLASRKARRLVDSLRLRHPLKTILSHRIFGAHTAPRLTRQTALPSPRRAYGEAGRKPLLVSGGGY